MEALPPPEGTLLRRASRNREQRSCGDAKLSGDFRNTVMGFITTEKHPQNPGTSSTIDFKPPCCKL